MIIVEMQGGWYTYNLPVCLYAQVGVEQEKVGKEKEIADTEEKKVAKINIEVTKKQKDCETDLAKAEPALKAAAEALNTLNKANLTELKSFGKPPPAVVNVTAAVMVLLAPAAKIPKDRSWNNAKVMMAKVDQFLDSLINFDKENIQDANLKAIDPYLSDKEFDPDFIRNKSLAAAGETLHTLSSTCITHALIHTLWIEMLCLFSHIQGLCSWAINIVRFYRVFCDVEPKRKALETANAELSAAQAKLSKIKAKIKVRMNSNRQSACDDMYMYMHM